MGSFLRRNDLRILSALAIITLACAAPGFAQADEDDAYPSVATLFLYSQPDGSTRVTFYSPVELTGNELRDALSAALGCNRSAFQAPEFSVSRARSAAEEERSRQAQRVADRHQLSAVCPTLLRHERMRSSLDLSLGGVLAILRNEEVDTLYVSIAYQNLYNLRIEGRQSLSSASGMVSFQLPVATDGGKIHLDWGYQEGDIVSPLVIVALFVVLPCLLILWMRSRALHLHTTDRAGAWFSYMRTQYLCTSAAFLVWIGGGYSARARFANVLTAAWGAESMRAAVLCIGYFLLPPLVVLTVSVLASYRVMVEVRQVPWRFRDFLGLQIAQLGMVLIPVLGVYCGLQLQTNFPLFGWSVVVIFFCSFPLGAYLRRKLTGRYPEPIISGEFHDRIFLLARRAGVTLKNIFLLPSGKLPVANAFASGNGILMVTDYILQKLNRREVEAIAAHEIGHLQYGHPKKLGFGIFGIILFPVFVRTVLPSMLYMTASFFPKVVHANISQMGDGLQYPALDFVVAIVCLLLFYALSRRFERVADERSVTLTDDPEALITAFAKLSLINLTPLQWGRGSEALITHPSTLKRIHRIARVGGVPEQRVQELLANPNAHDGPNAPVPTFESPRPASEFVYPPHEQMRRAQMNMVLLIAISIGVPTAFAYLAEALGQGGRLAWMILLVGVLLTFATYSMVYRWRAVGTRSMLRARFEAHFRRSYPRLDLSRAHLVGYSPEAWPRFYYVQPYWDIGLLVPSREGLVSNVDQAKFLLPYSSIDECVLGDGVPGWQKVRRTYIRWTQNGACGVMNFAALDSCSVFRVGTAATELQDSISGWLAKADSIAPAPPECATLGIPTAAQCKSKSPRVAYSFRLVIKLTLLAVLPAVLLTNVFVLVNSGTSMAPILYVPAVAFLLRFLEWLPYVRYKDRELSPEWTRPSKVVENRVGTSSSA